MFNIFFLLLVFTGILIWICFRLKNWKQRLIFLLVLLAGIPATLFFGFKWGWKNREAKLMKAHAECRQKQVIDSITLSFMGFNEKELRAPCLTMHQNANGQVLDSNSQQLDTTRFYDGTLGADYYYRQPFKTGDILEIRIGKKKYLITNFVLGAAANYNMGGAIVSGCKIDSADINGKRTPFVQNMIIRKTDEY